MSEDEGTSTTPPTPDGGQQSAESTPGAGGVQPDQPEQPVGDEEDEAEMQQGAREMGRRDAQQLMGRGWAPITSCQRHQEGCEAGSSHRSRALRGVLYSKHRVSEAVAKRLRDAWVVVHPPLRGQLDRSWLSILGRTPDGYVIPEHVWLQIRVDLRETGQDLLQQPMGHSRSLAHSGTATSWKERIQESRLVAVAKHSPLLRVALTPTIKGAATC